MIKEDADMGNAYGEDKLVQRTMAEFLEKELGWKYINAFEEKLGDNGTLGRKSQREVVLAHHLRKALKHLNPWIGDKQVDEVIATLTDYMASQTLMQINEEKYKLLREGVKVKRTKPDGETVEETVKIIDFNHPDHNEFLCVRELWVQGSVYRRRADIVGFVNGMPLLFAELKGHDVDVKDAFTQNYHDYLDTIPQLFHLNAFLIFSNGEEARIGTIDSKWEFFHEWKRLTENDSGSVELETMLRGVCRKENFLDLVENFLLYDRTGGRTAKIMAQNHQYLGVNQAVEMYRNRKFTNGKLGVFWHTQGSGKSYSMLFLAQKIRRKFSGSPTILILTDRDELNTQISERFENCSMLSTKADQCVATSGQDLIEKLKNNPSFIFSLIQKFNDPKATPIHPKHDIVVMSDEAHRTQNGVFADNLVHLLPTASRIGFTGTPLLRDDNITERTFGGYVSIYDFKRAIEDKATVPLYYENRGEKLQGLKNPEINEQIAAALEQAGDMDSSQQAKLEQEFSKEVHLLTAEKRLRLVARDFVRHYTDLWTSGKALVVCFNKVTCVRMYNYVQEYWQEEIALLEKQLDGKYLSQQEVQEMQSKLLWMKETDMAVVVSEEQNEVDTFRKWGLDIVPHRIKMKRKLDDEFKQADSPLRIVFVCAMWLTGFDVPTLSCLYIDKPMKAHTLMQTIARANRVADGKTNGLIVDYIGILKALRHALADYTANPDGDGKGNDPTIDKKELIKRVNEIISTAITFLKESNFNIKELMEAQSFNKLHLLKVAANAVCETTKSRKTYCTYITTLLKYWRYLDREDITQEMKEKKDALQAIYKELLKKRKHADITDISVAINEIVNEHLEISDGNEGEMVAEGKRFDISSIDFDLLHREFARSQEKNLMLKDIADLVQQRLDGMVSANPSRINFYERYQEIIEEYNHEQDRSIIEKTFNDLIRLSTELTEEQKRYIKEGFDNDEQLSMYDILIKGKENLSSADIKKLKAVSRDLLKTIKERLSTIDHPFDKPSTKAEIRIFIRDYLWMEMPSAYSDESLPFYRDAIYDYISRRYA